MGALLSALKERDLKDVFVDFENAAVPEGDEQGAVLQGLLDRAEGLIEAIEGYTGCGDLIRVAMTNPGEDSERPAWDAVLPRVRELKQFYEFSLALEAHVPRVLEALGGASAAGKPAATLVAQSSSARHLAEILSFSLRFDAAKMRTSQIANDFSFYRRIMARHPDEQVVSDDESYKISMFYAFSGPMMKAVATACAQFAKAEASSSAGGGSAAPNPATGGSAGATLATMANVCLSMVNTGKFEREETNLFCLRVMAGAIIVHDAVHPLGSFFKKSPVLIKKALGCIRGHEPRPEGLLDSIKFSCQHVNDEDTPKGIKELLA